MGNAQVSNASQVIKDYQQFMDGTYSKSNVNAFCTSTASNKLNLFAGTIPDPLDPGKQFFCAGGPDGFVAEGTTITFEQKASSMCTNYTKQTKTITSQVQDSISTTIQAFLKEQQDSKQGWLTLALSAQVENAKTRVELGNTIIQKVKSTTTQICNTTADSYNSSNVVLCGVYTNDNININQIAISNAYVSCTVDLMITAWQNDATLTDVALKTFTGQASKQLGIGSLFGWLVVIAIAVVIIVVIFGLIYLLSPGGNKGISGEREAQLLQMEEQGRGGGRGGGFGREGEGFGREGEGFGREGEGFGREGPEGRGEGGGFFRKLERGGEEVGEEAGEEAM